jgi:hypothetical protein
MLCRILIVSRNEPLEIKRMLSNEGRGEREPAELALCQVLHMPAVKWSSADAINTINFLWSKNLSRDAISDDAFEGDTAERASAIKSCVRHIKTIRTIYNIQEIEYQISCVSTLWHNDLCWIYEFFMFIDIYYMRLTLFPSFTHMMHEKCSLPKLFNTLSLSCLVKMCQSYKKKWTNKQERDTRRIPPISANERASEREKCAIML